MKASGYKGNGYGNDTTAGSVKVEMERNEEAGKTFGDKKG